MTTVIGMHVGGVTRDTVATISVVFCISSSHNNTSHDVERVKSGRLASKNGCLRTRTLQLKPICKHDECPYSRPRRPVRLIIEQLAHEIDPGNFEKSGATQETQILFH